MRIMIINTTVSHFYAAVHPAGLWALVGRFLHGSAVLLGHQSVTDHSPWHC